MAWQQLTMPLDGLDAAACEAVLLELGAVSITYTDAADQPILEPAPGEAPLWRDAIITALFPEDTSVARISLGLLSGLAQEHVPAFDIELLPERAWEREWLADFKPMRFGKRLWISPRHGAVDADGAVVVTLDPGLAFGTGTHATTALCLARLDGLDLAGKQVIDFGCGSGVLAIAAALLGAAAVEAIDIDPQALTATRNNAEENGVADRIRTATGDALAGRAAVADVLVANILAQPLIALAPTLAAALRSDGRLLLSGILDAQYPDVIDAYAAWIEFAPVTRQDGWILLEGNKRQ